MTIKCAVVNVEIGDVPGNILSLVNDQESSMVASVNKNIFYVSDTCCLDYKLAFRVFLSAPIFSISTYST